MLTVFDITQTQKASAPSPAVQAEFRPAPLGPPLRDLRVVRLRDAELIFRKAARASIDHFLALLDEMPSRRKGGAVVSKLLIDVTVEHSGFLCDR